MGSLPGISDWFSEPAQLLMLWYRMRVESQATPKEMAVLGLSSKKVTEIGGSGTIANPSYAAGEDSKEFS